MSRSILLCAALAQLIMACAPTSLMADTRPTVIENVISSLGSLRDPDDFVVAHAVLSLREWVLNSGQNQSLVARYQLSKPDITTVVTNLDREYLLVLFSSLKDDDSAAAFVIYQRCNSGLLLVAERGFDLFGSNMTKIFETASRDSSTDYFGRDACGCIDSFEEE